MQARLKAAREAEAEKRKTETSIPEYNATESLTQNDKKEPRSTTETSMILKKNYDYGRLSQIPVKLKPVEKYAHP